MDINELLDKYELKGYYFFGKGGCTSGCDEFVWEEKNNEILLKHRNNCNNRKAYHKQGNFYDYDIMFKYIKRHGERRIRK